MLGAGFRVLGRAIRDEPAMFIFGVLGSAVFAVMTVGSAFVLGAVVGRVAVPAFTAGHVGFGALTVGVTALLGVSVLKVLGVFGRRLGAGRMQFNLQARYRRQVTRQYLDLPPRWHQEHATGTLLSNANADVESAWYPIAPFPYAVGALVMLVAAVVSLLLVDWMLALVGIALFPLLFGVNILYSRAISTRVASAQQLRAEVSAIAHESFDGALVVKTMGREQAETDRFQDRADQLRDAMISVGRVQGVFDPVLAALPSLGTLAMLLVGALRLRAGAIDIGDVVSVAFLFTVLGFPVQAVGFLLAGLPRSVVGWQRVHQVLTATGQLTYGTVVPAGTGPVTLTFDKITFGYADGPPVLSEVSFEVPAGRTVALVGPTGSGKSTIASLVTRLMEPASGTITLGGVDIRQIAESALPATVALVPQVPFVFDDTVRGNVSLDRDGIDDTGVWDALRAASADGFVAALPEGLSTAVGERGATLSGGQRQRLTLARALAGRPRLLVLDDATSAVDPRVEATILGALRSAGTSLLVVAYRRATIALADEVIYVEEGRVVARGQHTDLLARVPAYAQLVNAYADSDPDAAGDPGEPVDPGEPAGLDSEVPA